MPLARTKQNWKGYDSAATVPLTDALIEEPLEVNNTELPEHSDWKALGLMTIWAFLLTPVIGAAFAMAFDWRPSTDTLGKLAALTVLLSFVPLGVVMYLHFRRMLREDKRHRKLVQHLEQRLQVDLNRDSVIGMVAPPRDDDWFMEAVMHWHRGGSTTFAESEHNLRLSLVQWQAARDALVEAGIATRIQRQGGNAGFIMKKQSRGEILSRLPRTPYIAQDVVPLSHYRLEDAHARITTLS